MNVVAFTSRVSGSGKSMLAAHLSVQTDSSNSAVIIDATLNGSLASWHERRGGNSPVLLRCEGAEIVDTLESVRREKIKWVFLDTDASTQAEGVRAAHLVVVPLRPSASVLSFAAAAGMIEMGRALGKTALLVINAAPPRRADGSEHPSVAAARKGLTPLGVSVWPWQITKRTAFSDAFASGQTVGESASDSPAVGEVVALWETVKLYLQKQATM